MTLGSRTGRRELAEVTMLPFREYNTFHILSHFHSQHNCHNFYSSFSFSSFSFSFFFFFYSIYWAYVPHIILHKIICKIKWFLIPRDPRPGTNQSECERLGDDISGLFWLKCCLDIQSEILLLDLNQALSSKERGGRGEMSYLKKDDLLKKCLSSSYCLPGTILDAL